MSTQPSAVSRTLTDLAVAAFPFFTAGQRFGLGIFGSGDPFIDAFAWWDTPRLHQLPELRAAVATLESVSDLDSVKSVEGQSDAMIFGLAGGQRQDFAGLIVSLLTSARQLMISSQVEDTVEAFSRIVLDNYEELRRAACDRTARVYNVLGYAGVNLPVGQQLSLPWGVMHSVPELQHTSPILNQPARLATRVVLLSPVVTEVFISRDPQPNGLPFGQRYLDEAARIQLLLPLAFLLAASTGTNFVTPVLTFQTSIKPFSSNSNYSRPLIFMPFVMEASLTGDQIQGVEYWGRLIGDRHHSSLDIAARRLLSAASQRFDRADALIDAVTAWESLVGARAETAYRVTTALTKLLEPDPAGRKALRKELENVYDSRSRVVHGDSIDPQKVIDHAATAISIGVRALRLIYERGGDWPSITGKVRADRLVLDL